MLICGVIALIGNIVLQFMGLNIGQPSISVSMDRTAVEISADSALRIQYKLSSGSNRNQWIEYSGPIEGVKENTVIRARATMLWGLVQGDENKIEIIVDPSTGLLYEPPEKIREANSEVGKNESNKSTREEESGLFSEDGWEKTGFRIRDINDNVIQTERKGNVLYYPIPLDFFGETHPCRICMTGDQNTTKSFLRFFTNGQYSTLELEIIAMKMDKSAFTEFTVYKDDDPDCLWQQAAIPIYVKENHEVLSIEGAQTITMEYSSAGAYKDGVNPGIIINQIEFK